MPSKGLNIKGQKFGQLRAVVATSFRDESGSVVWECECDCGEVTFASCRDLISGHKRSCGCLQRNIFLPSDSATSGNQDAVVGFKTDTLSASNIPNADLQASACSTPPIRDIQERAGLQDISACGTDDMFVSEMLGGFSSELQNAVEQINVKSKTPAQSINLNLDNPSSATKLSNALLVSNANFTNDGYSLNVKNNSFSVKDLLGVLATDDEDDVVEPTVLRFEPQTLDEENIKDSKNIEDFEHEITRAKEIAHAQNQTDQYKQQPFAAR